MCLLLAEFVGIHTLITTRFSYRIQILAVTAKFSFSVFAHARTRVRARDAAGNREKTTRNKISITINITVQ